jgi:hypothetical protein
MDKFCNKCSTNKSTDNFYINEKRKDGFHPWCTDCSRRLAKERREANSKREVIEYPETKKCSRCKEVKSATDFNKTKSYPDGLNCDCRECNNKQSNKYYSENKEQSKVYRAKPEVIERRQRVSKEYIKINREEINKYQVERRNSDPAKKIENTIRSRVWRELKDKTGKEKHIIEYAGCSSKELKDYLEKLFLPTMSWGNYASLWEIDHIKPCSSFDLTIKEQQDECFHYANLQPLFTYTITIEGITYIGNRNKNSKLVDSIILQQWT